MASAVALCGKRGLQSHSSVNTEIASACLPNGFANAARPRSLIPGWSQLPELRRGPARNCTVGDVFCMGSHRLAVRYVDMDCAKDVRRNCVPARPCSTGIKPVADPFEGFAGLDALESQTSWALG